MITIRDLYRELNRQIPPALTQDGDNDGLMCCPSPEHPANRILVTLDITDQAVNYAIANRFDLIVSHHPLMFRGIKRLDPDNPVARKTIALCRADIAAFSFHTRLDALSGGVNDALAALLGLSHTTPFGSGLAPMGRIGDWEPDSTSHSATEFAEHVANQLHCPCVLLSDAGRPVRRVAVLGGEGKDEWTAVLATGADTFVSGRIGYHLMVDAPETGMNLIEAGHYYTEFPVCRVLEQLLRSIVPESNIEIFNGNTERIRCIRKPLQKS